MKDKKIMYAINVVKHFIHYKTVKYTLKVFMTEKDLNVNYVIKHGVIKML